MTTESTVLFGIHPVVKTVPLDFLQDERPKTICRFGVFVLVSSDNDVMAIPKTNIPYIFDSFNDAKDFLDQLDSELSKTFSVKYSHMVYHDRH